MGFKVLLVGRKLNKSLPLKPRNYEMKRMWLVFNRGPLFYAEYNFRLFIFLIFHKADLLVSNDLDTLLANYIASKIKRLPLVHDCHEYFRGVPELNGRPGTMRIWKLIEDHIFPKLRSVYAVNQSIAEIYHKEYGNDVRIIRNVPVRKLAKQTRHLSELGLPEDARIILYQGAVNVDRGLEEAIMAMKYITGKYYLVIIGTGDILEKLKRLPLEENVADRVIFTGPIPFQELHSYTLMADVGISIEKDVSLNYHYCLPNKFLDYIQAEVPVLVSSLPEMKAIVERYDIGEMIENHDPKHIADKITMLLNNPQRMATIRNNLHLAASELCWENEEKELLKIYSPYVR